MSILNNSSLSAIINLSINLSKNHDKLCNKCKEKKNVNSMQTRNKNRKNWKENINFIDYFPATLFFSFFYFYFYFFKSTISIIYYSKIAGK